MVRSSYSSIIYEGYDFSCAIMDGEGQLGWRNRPRTPVSRDPGGVERSSACSQSQGEIGEDDLFLHNDPYTGGTHLE